MSAHDLHDTDPHTGYSLARHVLDELLTWQSIGEPLDAAELGAIVGDQSGRRAGTWLRELHTLGLVYFVKVSPGSTRGHWYVTDLGEEVLRLSSPTQRPDPPKE